MKLRSMFAFLLAAVLAAGMLPVPGRALETEPFEDVKETSWYAPYVMALHRQHVIEGMDGTHFGPSRPLTRAQLVTMLTPELGEEAMELYKNRKRFSDVAPGAWYAPYVNWASEQGWVSGYEDGTFRPDRPLTRAEASVILIAYCTKTENPILSGRLPELEEPKDEKEIPGWAADAVHKSLRAGLFRGYPDGTFGPGRTITRAEIAAVLCRVFDLDVNGSEETPEEPEEPVTADGITTQSYPVLGTTVNIVSFHPEDGFEADVILANDQLYSSEAASSMVKRSGAAVAVNGTYFNNSDLGVLSSFVRDGKVLRIENAHSQYKPYFVVDSEGNCSFQNMKILQTAALSRDGTAVPEAVLEEVGCNYRLAEDDGTRMVYTREYGETVPGTMEAAVICDGSGTVVRVVDSWYGEEIDIPEEGFVLCERHRRDKDYTTKWETFFEEASVGDTVTLSVNYEGSQVQDIRTAFCAGPTIVKDGRPYGNAQTYQQEGFTDRKILYGLTARIGLGVKEDGTVVIITATTTLFGLSTLMAAAGCRDAMNLDGGASTALYGNGEALATPVRKLTHMVVFFKK